MTVRGGDWPASRHQDMGGGGEEGEGGHQGEGREGQQAHAVQDDRGELPVGYHQGLLLTGLDVVRDDPELLQYEGQLPGGRHVGGGGVRQHLTRLLPAPAE